MNGGVLSFAVRSLARRRGRAFVLGAGLALTVVLVAAILFVTDALRAEARRASAAVPGVVVQRLVGGRPSAIATSEARKLEGIPAVRSVRPRVWGYLFVPELQGNVVIVGVASGAPTLDAVHGVFASGADLRHGAHEMVAGKRLATTLGLGLGDEMQLPTATPSPPLKLTGTFSSSVEIWTADVILCDDADARALLGLGEGEATDLALDLTNPDEEHVVASTALERIPNARVVEGRSLLRVYEAGYGRRAGLLFAASIPALVALLLLAWDRASGLGPAERREVAILKAVGFGTRDVLVVKLWEAGIVAAVATAVGFLVAYAWVFVLGAPGLRAALVGWSVLYPETPLVPAVDVSQLVGVAAAVVAPYMALSIVPAWRAAIVDPMQAMRE
jgi:ABC-type lipoprotein release transport system permease subunit